MDERRQTQCLCLTVDQIRQTGKQEEVGGKICSRQRSWKTEHSESISIDFAGGDAQNSVAREFHVSLAQELCECQCELQRSPAPV